MLDTKAWAKQKVRLWTDNTLQFIGFLQGCSLRHCHRMWQSFLRKSISRATESSKIASLSLELLISRGLVKRGVRDDLNADGEDVIVQAGGDGWLAGDIAAAVAAGAHLRAIDSNGCNGVWNAARYGHVDSLNALLRAGVEVNKCSNQGASPLYFAAANGHTACIALLLSFGGNVNMCNNNGSSPIFTAAASGYDNIVKQLAAAGGDVNLCHSNGASPVFAASEHGYAECILQLVSFGGDINKCKNDGISPICIAAHNGHASCVALLLSFGANPHDVKSVRDSARQQGHFECVRLIEAALM
jgi:ankyrin repeat protein